MSKESLEALEPYKESQVEYQERAKTKYNHSRFGLQKQLQTWFNMLERCSRKSTLLDLARIKIKYVNHRFENKYMSYIWFVENKCWACYV